MKTPSMTISSVALTSTNQIDGILSGYKWGDASITYSFPDSATYYASLAAYADKEDLLDALQPMVGTYKDAIRRNLDTSFGTSADDGFSVEGFTLNISISETADYNNSNIRAAQSSATHEYASSDYWAVPPFAQWADSGDLWIQYDPGENAARLGGYHYFNTMHLLGLTLGLKHAHESINPNAILFPNGQTITNSGYDAMEYSVMSFRDYPGENANGTPDFYQTAAGSYAQTFMMSDIAALQHMYGADYTINSGNTTYSWDPATGETKVNGTVALSNYFNNKIFLTIWDGDGTDTYDLSAYTTDLDVDLNAGGNTDFGTQRADLGGGHVAQGNVYNALMFGNDTRSLIENAIGGAGDDTIQGNVKANGLTGSAGADKLYGFVGNDTLVGNGGADRLYGGDGNDTLNGGSNEDYINGDAGDDALTGGLGVDRFHFNIGDGHDVILDYDKENDQLVFWDMTASYNSKADLIDHMTNVTVGGVTSCVLTYSDAGDTITFQGVAKNQVDDGWFEFTIH